MGKTIDRLALALLGATGFYLLFLHLGLPIPLCCLAAFGCMAATRAAADHIPRRHRATPAQARAALLDLALLPEDEALARLKALTGRDALLPVLRHPSARLDAAELFDLWRAHRDEGMTCAAVTCPADPGAFEFARTQGIELIDAPALERQLRRTGLFIPPDAPRPALSHRLRRAFNAAMDRPASPRAALYGVSLMAMYQVTGRFPYLLCGLSLLGITGAKFIRRAT